MACAGLGFWACDFNGPWSFYPEEREVYTGIYTYGYVVENETPYVCFSKTYQLSETSAENFAFYDSASVSVSGAFGIDGVVSSEKTVKMEPEEGRPKCFVFPESAGRNYGVAGEIYKLKATFVWDSAGTKVKSKFEADAKIPENFGVKGVNVPQKDGSYKWYDLKDSADFKFDFLEFPMDMSTYSIPLDYNETVGGVVLTMQYDVHEGGESMNTTINSMLSGMVEKDSMGYTGVSMNDPLESMKYGGFEENRSVAGINMLDTLFVPSMNMPIGKNVINIYATDDAYFKYHEYVLGSMDDPRVIPQSNIKNGMGVFSGMSRVSFSMDIVGDQVDFKYIAVANCSKGSGFGTEAWSSKGCRLYQDVYCAGLGEVYSGEKGELYKLNETAAEYYRTEDYKNYNTHDFCYAPAVKAAMMLDTNSWAAFLPDSIDKGKKDNAYADGLKRYCVANDFKTTKIADCKEMNEQCNESLDANSCKEYLWQWCDDRGWDLEKYHQCGSGLVSRYYLKGQKSKTLKKVVDSWCKENKNDPQCKRK